MTEVYEYSANVCFIGEYITINHDGWLETDEVIDLDTAGDRLIDQSDDFIKDYYGFSPKALATVDIEVDWRVVPMELDQ